MIESIYEEAFSTDWISRQITDETNELVILRQVIPWQPIINRLVKFYSKNKGRIGTSLRIMIALLILSRFRQLSDRTVVSRVQENRYLQYFCNVPDEKLEGFLNPSSLCKFRKRLGEEGIRLIENEVFNRLRNAGIIQGDTLLMDSSVLANNIIYPNDVLLVYKAFLKMFSFAKEHGLTLWWDHIHIKKRWRAFGLAKKEERATYLAEFYLLFVRALTTFRTHVAIVKFSDSEKAKSQSLLELLTLLEMQTQQKLSGKRHIDHRIVSLDEVDARPIKKGKTHPACEFGSTIQMTFNRQGFMITTENFIGNPSDKNLYGNTLELYKQRMEIYPDTLVTDLGFRSEDNFKKTPKEIESLFLGRSSDVADEKKDFCRKARSATEGFIAVAKNLRGFSKSFYRRFVGDKIWTLLCQTAYNLKKALQLYQDGKLEEQSLINLGLLA